MQGAPNKNATAFQRPRLQWKDMDGQEHVFALGDREVVLGRGKDGETDVHLDNASISRRHSRISKTDKGYAVSDLNSKFGTCVNEDRIEQQQLLRDGDPRLPRHAAPRRSQAGRRPQPTEQVPVREVGEQQVRHPVPVSYRSPGRRGVHQRRPRPAFLFRAASSEIEELPSNNLLVGAFESITYQAAPLAVGPGDVLIVYSDGLVEAEDAAGRMLGRDRVKDVIRSEARQGAAHLEARLLEAVARFTRGHPQYDDITLIVVERTK